MNNFDLKMKALKNNFDLNKSLLNKDNKKYLKKLIDKMRNSSHKQYRKTITNMDYVQELLPSYRIKYTSKRKSRNKMRSTLNTV